MGGQIAAAIGIGFSVDKLFQFTKAAIDSAEALGRLSKESGFSVSTLEAIRKQTTEAGIGFEELQGSLVLFVAKMQEARDKGGAAMDVFRNIGQDVALAVAQGKPAEQVYGAIADKFKTGAVAGREAATAHELFGKSFKEWIPILDEGIDGLDRFRALGGGITPEAVQQATDFNREWRTLKEITDEVFRQFAADILPTLKSGVEYMSELTTQTDAVSQAAKGMSDVFKGVVAVGLVVGTVFVDIGKVIGISIAGWTEIFSDEYDAIKQIVSQIKSFVSDTVDLLADLSGSVLDAKEVIASALSGNFSGARSLLESEFGLIKQDVKLLGQDAAAGFAIVPAQFKKMVDNIGAMDGQALFDIYSQWSGISGFVGKMFSGTNGTPAGASGKSAPAGSLPTTQPKPAYVTPDTQMKELEFLSAKAQLQAKIIQSNPYVTEIEKARQLIPVLSQENDLLGKQIAVQQAVIADPTRTDEERAKANLEIVRLQGQQNDLLREQQKLQGQSSFGIQFGDTITQLQNKFGTIAQQTASTFAEVFNSAINSISKGITGLIEGTMRWGQALREIGTSILDSIIQAIVKMFVTWILQMTILALLQKLFGQQSTQQASQSAEAWGPAAVAASIASYGAASAVGTAAALAGMALGAAFGGALSGGSGFAEGGFTGAGGKYQPAGIVHRGEYVMPAATVNRLGVPYLDRLADSNGADSVSPMLGGAPEIHVNLFDDRAKLNNHLRNNPEAQHIILDTLGNNINRFA